MNYWQQSEHNIYVAAHRGWSEKYPENTMLAFRQAAMLGVDQIEIDVRVTKDNELVVIHDAYVDRTTNGIGLVREKTLAEIQALDAGSHKGNRFRGEKIPTFLEFMDFVKTLPTMTVDVELKEYPIDGREAVAYDVCDRILSIIDDYDFADRVVINSWSGKLLEYIYRKHGKKYRIHSYYPVCHLGHIEVNPIEYSYCACMFQTVVEQVNLASKWECDRMKSFGIQPWAGASIRDEKGVDALIERGATLVTCNNPDVILNLLRQKGYHA